MESKNTVVIGIGGVGGYLSGMLCKTYDDITVSVRENRKEILAEKGIVLHSEHNGEICVSPSEIVTSLKHMRKTPDIIFVCVKNYSLDALCEEIKEVIDEHTIIVPVMNGTDAADRIRRIVKKGHVIDCVIYIVSCLNPDYSITQTGPYAKLVIGSRTDQQSVNEVCKYLQKAGIDCVISDSVESAVWEKYIFNCAFNIETSYYMTDAKGLRMDKERIEEFCTLLKEAIDVAEAKGIVLRNHYMDEEYQRFLDLEDIATSSLKRDMEKGVQNELETFSGYLVREAKHLGVSVPLSEKMYQVLKERNAK